MPLTYKILAHQSIFDALVTTQVPIDNIISILHVSGLDLDSELAGESIVYEASEVVKPKGGQKATFTAPLTDSYLTNSAQNLFDVCLMTLGDLNKFVHLVSSNDFNSTNDYPDGVMEVNYSYSDVTDSGFKLALKKSNINITTGIVEQVFTELLLQENGYYLLQENGFRILIT